MTEPYTSRDVAVILGITESGVRKLVQRGALTPERPGRRPLRFTRDHVQQVQVCRLGAGHLAFVRSVYAEVDGMLG